MVPGVMSERLADLVSRVFDSRGEDTRLLHGDCGPLERNTAVTRVFPLRRLYLVFGPRNSHVQFYQGIGNTYAIAIIPRGQSWSVAGVQGAGQMFGLDCWKQCYCVWTQTHVFM